MKISCVGGITLNNMNITSIKEIDVQHGYIDFTTYTKDTMPIMINDLSKMVSLDNVTYNDTTLRYYVAKTEETKNYPFQVKLS